MRRIPTPGKEYPFQLYFSELDEIDRICLAALRQQNLLPEVPAPIRIDRFIEKQFGCPLTFDDMDPGFLGCCVFNPTGLVERIAIARFLGEDERPIAQRRVRSTYAHEAGHGLLHGCLFVEEQTPDLFTNHHEEKQRRRFLCRDGEVGQLSDRCYDGKWWEFQANRAIGGLLLPKLLVAEAVKPFAKVISPLGALVLEDSRREAAVHEVAAIFEVSQAAARFRLGEIFSQNVLQNLL